MRFQKLLTKTEFRRLPNGRARDAYKVFAGGLVFAEQGDSGVPVETITESHRPLNFAPSEAPSPEHPQTSGECTSADERLGKVPPDEPESHSEPPDDSAAKRQKITCSKSAPAVGLSPVPPNVPPPGWRPTSTPTLMVPKPKHAARPSPPWRARRDAIAIPQGEKDQGAETSQQKDQSWSSDTVVGHRHHTPSPTAATLPERLLEGTWIKKIQEQRWDCRVRHHGRYDAKVL